MEVTGPGPAVGTSAMWLDPVSKKIYIYGGVGETYPIDGTYSIDISSVSDSVAGALTITPLSITTPGPRSSPVAWSDNRLAYVFGGYSFDETSGTHYNDLWVFSGVTFVYFFLILLFHRLTVLNFFTKANNGHNYVPTTTLTLRRNSENSAHRTVLPPPRTASLFRPLARVLDTF
jgi:hypothetical protein